MAKQEDAQTNIANPLQSTFRSSKGFASSCEQFPLCQNDQLIWPDKLFLTIYMSYYSQPCFLITNLVHEIFWVSNLVRINYQANYDMNNVAPLKY